MILVVAALGAIAAALLELTFLPALRIGGFHPDLVLVLAVLWTLFAGLEGGLACAFVGGLMVDVLADRPLGSTPLALLICVAVAALVARVLEPARWIGPALATCIIAVLYAGLLLVIDRAARGPVPMSDLPAAFLQRALVDGAIGGIMGMAGIWLRGRRGPTQDWLGR